MNDKDQALIQSIADSLGLIDEIQVKRLQSWMEFSSGLKACVDIVEENQRREDSMRDKVEPKEAGGVV